MNRPALPLAISSISADQLESTQIDSSTFSMTIGRLLARFDAADAVAATFGAVASSDLYQPVSARTHVNRDRRTSGRKRVLLTV